jgi:5-methyltetrahydrofolate--homocysteine methyltransferase
VGLRGSRGGSGPTYEELVETEGRPRLRRLLAQVQAEGIMQAAVVHGYFPAVSKGDDLIVLDPARATSGCRFTFPRSGATGTCACRLLAAAGVGRDRRRGLPGRHDGPAGVRGDGEMFARNAYREYLELHGLSVQLTEALAELWHARVRAELGFGDEDAPTCPASSKLEHRGRATPGATRRARTSRTRRRSRTCSSGSGSASSCRRSSS